MAETVTARITTPTRPAARATSRQLLDGLPVAVAAAGVGVGLLVRAAQVPIGLLLSVTVLILVGTFVLAVLVGGDV